MLRTGAASGSKLIDARLLDRPRQQRQHAVDLVAHFLRGDVDVLVEQEPDHDLRDALGRDRAQLVDAADGVDASSILSVTSVSICSGAAPGCTVVTTMVGKSILGKRSTPSFVNEKAPTTVSDR